jgi:hypothetical protein
MLQVGLAEATLVCTVEDNPEPVEFKLACNGEKPKLEIDGSKLEFRRLLIGSDDTRQLTVKNTCLLPVKWRLVGAEQLPEEFSVSQKEGLLEPLTVSTAVTVRFNAMKNAAFQHDFKLQVRTRSSGNFGLHLHGFPLASLHERHYLPCTCDSKCGCLCRKSSCSWREFGRGLYRNLPVSRSIAGYLSGRQRLS